MPVMRERSWTGLEPNAFRLHQRKAVRFFEREQPIDPVHEALWTLALTGASIVVYALVCVLRHEQIGFMPGPTFLLIAFAFINRSYDLLNVSDEVEPVAAPGDLLARLKRCQTAGQIHLLGAFAASWLDGDTFHILVWITGLATILFLLRVRVIARHIARNSPSRLPSG